MLLIYQQRTIETAYDCALESQIIAEIGALMKFYFALDGVE